MAGTPNKFTGSFRQAVAIVYDGLGGHQGFLKWARKNQTEFYKIAARLIPTELRREEDRTVRVIIAPPPPRKAPVRIGSHSDMAQGSEGT